MPKTTAGCGHLFDQYQFQSVLNCAGNCALRACELDSRLAWRTNVEGLINLLSIVVERDVRLVHLSIDLVFSGERCQEPTRRRRPAVIVESAWRFLPPAVLRRIRPQPIPLPSTAKRWSPPSSSWPTGCPTRAFCGFRCRWASVSTAMPARSTGFNRGSRKAARQRCISTKSARPLTPIV